MTDLPGELTDRDREKPVSLIVEPFLIVWRHRRLLDQTVRNAVRQRNAGSVLGIFWIVFTPLLFLGIYSTVYSTIFRVRPPDMNETEYLLLLISGLLAFLAFAEALAAGTTALSANRVILLNAVFPAHLIPLNTVLTAHASSLAGFAILVVAVVLMGRSSWTLLFVPIVLMLQMMFLTGLSWLLSPIRLVFPDLQNIISPLVLLLAIASPIAYTPQMVPTALQGIIYLNPLSYFVLPFQFVIVRAEIPPLSLFALTVTFSIATYIAGYWCFKRISRIFVDYV